MYKRLHGHEYTNVTYNAKKVRRHPSMIIMYSVSKREENIVVAIERIFFKHNIYETLEQACAY